MQSSFWKTVAVVGVIGIGSLAILEVQNRLKLPNTAVSESTEETDALAKQIAETGDQSVEALLTKSQFEQMMVTTDSGQPQFDMTEPEPQLQETQLKPTPVAQADQQFFSSEPVAPQQVTPPVNTNVRAEQLVQGGNPFGAQTAFSDAGLDDAGAVTAVAANYQGQPQPVEPVGFQDETFGEDETPSTTQPFRRDDVAPAAEPEAASPFSLFGADSDTEPAKPAADTRQPELPLSNNPFPPAANNRAGSMQFINGAASSNGTSTSSAATNANSGQTSGSPFYQEDAAPLRPTPPADPVPFQEFGPSGRGSDAAPTLEVPAFGDPGSGRSTLPTPQPESMEEDGFGAAGGLFTEDEDLVPTPVEPNSATPDFNQPEPNREIFQPQPRPEPVRAAPELNNSLPFAEDAETDIAPRVLDVPALEAPGRLSIPETRPEIPNSPRYEDRTDFNTNSPDIRPFPNTPNSTPTLNFPEPSRPLSNGTREFNGGGVNGGSDVREFDNNGSREFGSELNIVPRNSNGSGGSPEFSGGSSFPQPATRTNRDTQIRQVSGVMRPNLVLQKDAPENATVGSPLEYTISVSNEGDATAFEVLVEDEMPTGATVDGANPQPEVDRTTRRMVWKFAEVAPGETKRIVVRVTPTGEGTLDTVASVKFKSRVKATTVITAPKLRLEMVGPDEVKLGEEVPYRYIITNEGSGEARDVFVRTVLPASGGLKHPQGRDLEYEIGNMTPGQQRELVLAVVAAEPGEFKTEAEVSATGGAKDQAAYRTNVIGAQLQIVRRGPKRRFVGRPATYENIVSNETNFDAVDAQVVESVPTGMRFMNASSGGQYDAASRTVTWRINRLGPGRQEQLQIELMPEDAGARESIVKIFENAGLQSDDYVSTTVVEDLHNVGAKMTRLDQPMAVGETFGFTITIDNRGTADATDVQLMVEVPSGINVIGAGSKDNQAKLQPGNVVQYSTIVRIAPNEQQSFEIKMEGKEPVQNGLVKAKVNYKQMQEELIVSESVTIYRDQF